jgi:adenylosuccinate lyase
MQLNALTAISPIDGRYRATTSQLAEYFSEYSLIKFRIFIEIEYFIALCNIPLPQLKSFDRNNFLELRKIFTSFTVEDAQAVKNFEKITNHDVKAVEYFLKSKFVKLNLSEYKEFIHFGLTSQDITNTAIPLLLKEYLNKIYNPLLKNLKQQLTSISEQCKDISMISRTHGQPASPTRMGKEIYVFIERITRQESLLESIPNSAKFGGASGNLNAHYVAYPDIDWKNFANNFVNNILGLDRSQTTTQIEHYDNLSALFDNLKRINTILIDLDRDIWTYISMDYFKLKINRNEVGSSAMPHKVNPIDFENSEGNLMIANALFEFLSSKLPVSRLQRDLTDSTVLRNIGVPMAHTYIAFDSLIKGISKININEAKINQDLESNWLVISEAIQTILRREGYNEPYEKLKDLTRKNTLINKETLHDFITALDVNDSVKDELKKITPYNYTGK